MSFDKPIGEVKTSFCSASEANKGGKLPNLCQPSRQAETSFNKPMGEVKTSFCSASEANKGRSLKPLQSRQAETSFDKPMGEVRQLSVCKRSEQGANSQTFASKLARTAHSFDPMAHRLLIF